MGTRNTLFLLVGSALVPLGSGQTRSISGELNRGAQVHHDVVADPGGDPGGEGVHWVRGRSYKASAFEGGFTFLPFLGSQAPRNYPIRFKLQRVERGDVALDLEGDGQVSRTGERLLIRRGTVDVRYDVSLESVEQSFALQVPEGEGDLKLVVDVETDLSVEAHHGGFRFLNELGGVTYGAATVLDARGHEASVPLVWTGDAIEFVVPEAFLETAVGPIVIDPLLTPFSVATGAADLDAPDADYDPTMNRYCVVFEERFSATDIDVISLFIRATDGAVSGSAYIDQTTASWSWPRITKRFASQDFVIVAEGDSVAVPGSKDIVARGRTVAGVLTPATVLISATSTYSCVTPDIGADKALDGAAAVCVVFYRDLGAHRDVYFTSFNTLPSTPTFSIPVESSAVVDESGPAISRGTGTFPALNFAVAWSVRDLVTGEASVRACRVPYTGGGPGQSFQVAPSITGGVYFDVDVSVMSDLVHPGTSEPYYAVTFDDRPSNLTDAFVSICAGETWLGTEELQISEHADRVPNQDDLVIGSSARYFMLAYSEGGVLQMTTMQPVDGRMGIVERRAAVMGSDVAPSSLCFVTPQTSMPTQGTGFLIWAQNTGSSQDIMAARASAPMGTNAAGWNYCYGTMNSTGDRGYITATGTRQPSALHTLHVESLPPNVFGYFLASMTTASVPNAAGSQGTLCVGGSVGRFGLYHSGPDGSSTHSVNPLQIAQPMGATAATAGQVWAFQSWYRDSVAGVATSNFTNGATLSFL